jgi:hypothetical protein
MVTAIARSPSGQLHAIPKLTPRIFAIKSMLAQEQ